MRTIKKWSLVPSRHQISTNHKWHIQMFFLGSGMRGGGGGPTVHFFPLNVNNHIHMIISANFKQGVVDWGELVRAHVREDWRNRRMVSNYHEGGD